MSSTVIDADANENTCVVCFKNATIYSIGECDHPVCYECSTRMRVLCRQNECPICRQDLSKVYFTKKVVPFRNVRHLESCIYDRKFNIYFDSTTTRNEFHHLLEHPCKICPGRPTFRNFATLKDHIRREHELFFCDLCVENLRIFTTERRCYTRSELGQHRRKGDADDRSHRGHPLCEFCEQRYVDNDELFRHLRREHLFCHFCDAEGYHQFYGTYNYLRDHFRREHYLCEEGNCINEQFTSVYRSEIDLKAHKASVHSRSLGKAATKQARTLELEFTLAPRSVPERSRRIHGLPPPEEEAIFETFNHVHPQPQPVASINTNCIQEFPTLSGAPPEPAAIIRTIRSTGPSYSGTPLAVTDENFPALGPDTNSAASSNPSNSSAGPSLRLRVNQTKSPPNVSIHFNHRHNGGISSQNIRIREDFPSLGGNNSITTPIGASWVSVSGGSQKKPTTSNTNPSTNKNKNKVAPKSDDFPALSQSFNAYCTVAPKTATNKQQQQQQQNEEKSPPSKINKKKNKATKNNAKKEEPSTSPTNSSNSNKQSNGIERKRSELRIEPAVPPPGFTAPPPGFTNTNTGPPPGFSSVTLNSIARANNTTPTNGLTFTNSSGQSYAIIPDSNITTNSSQYIFAPPADFTSRNKNLVTRVMNTLEGDSSLETFRQYSTMFRQGLYSAECFYNHCLNAMGPSSFEEIFPELLTLLPDINKQQELWRVHRTSAIFGPVKGLEECATCRQVLAKSDLRYHLRTHSLENNFPVLGAPSETNNAWRPRK